MPNMKRILNADCLEVLQDSRLVSPGSVGLVYLDPPYGTERLYSAGLRRRRSALKSAEPEAFDDRWQDYRSTLKLPKAVESVVAVAEAAGGARLGAYVRFMAERLTVLVPTLSKSASVYVHVAPAVAPYLRLVLDALLGAQCFRNEISWKRTHAHSSSRRYGPVHDTILFYARDGFQWHWPKTPADPAYFEKHYRKTDAEGRCYQLVTCTGPGDRTGTRAHYEWRGKLPPPGRHWAWKIEEMERLEASGRIEYSRTGTPRRIYYADEHQGIAVQDIWSDISRLDSHSKERLGYDTQKPLALLERIVGASLPRSGELVFDGFMGTGTTLLAAELAGADWVGCDVSVKATSLALGRLAGIGVRAEAVDWQAGPSTYAEAEKLAKTDLDAFCVWAAGMLGMVPDPKLASTGVLFAQDTARDRCVAGARVRREHLDKLRTAQSNQRYVVSLNPIPASADVAVVPVDLLVRTAERGKAPVDRSLLKDG